MKSLAEQLNTTLSQSVAGRLLSDMGERMFFPRGIVAQSAEAQRRADRFNATVGMACSQKRPIILPTLQRHIPTLGPKESVAYAPTAGQPALRDAWKQLLVSKNPSLQDKRFLLPIVTSGITHGISILADLFADEADTLIVPDLYWGNYRLIFQERRKATIAPFPFFTESGTFNLDALNQVLEQQTKKTIIILNFPNNPSGYSLTTAEVAALQEMVKRHADRGLDMLVIFDDAYFGLFYEKDIMRESLFALFCDLHENILAVKADGITKEDYAWGLRVGFLTFGGRELDDAKYEALEKKTMGAIRSSVSNVSNVSQHLALKLFQDSKYSHEKKEYLEILQARYEIVQSCLAKKDHSLLTPLPFNSGYFMAFILQKGSAEMLRLALLEKGIGVIAVNEQIVRVAFASVDADVLSLLYDELYAAAGQLT